MPRIDPQNLVDRLFAFSLSAPSISIDITERGKQRDVTITDVRLLLQRRRIGPDGEVGEWDTVIRLIESHLSLVEGWVAVAQFLDPAVQWRCTAADGTPIEQPEEGSPSEP